VLSELGFTEGEEKVYTALLKLGRSTSGNIAKEANVSRSKLYEILEKLVEKEVVSKNVIKKVTYFQAAPPKSILDFIERKKKKLNEQKEDFKKALPYFESFIGKKEYGVEVFEGEEGIKSVREIALNKMQAGDTMYYFGNPASGHEGMLDYWNDWNKRRINKKILAYIIYNQDAKKFGKRRKEALTKVKYLPKKGNSHAWVEIYGDTVAITLKHKTPMSVVFNNKFVADSFKGYFDILWSVSLEYHNF